MFHKIKAVHPLKNYNLLVTFFDDTQKVYDCKPLLEETVFEPIKNVALFKTVTVDPGGYGISWNEQIDLSEEELWRNGREAGEFDKLPEPLVISAESILVH